MAKWLTKFLENKSQRCTANTDITDRFASNANMSVLSVPSGRPFCKNPENISKMSTDSTDITNRFSSNANMSVLSGLSGPLHESFEERLAISEYDGQQTHLQAQRIAYLDASIAVLASLPYEEKEGHYDEDWLTRRIKATQHYLAAQGLQQPK